MSRIIRAAKATDYSLAGNQLGTLARIAVSRSVELPDVTEDGELRPVSYRAPEDSMRRRFAIPLPWAALMIVLALAIMSGTCLRKARMVSALETDFDQLRNKYNAFELERRSLEEQLVKASDANYVCYYAAQNLGMTLAVNEETIQVFAPNTRPLMGETQALGYQARQ